MAKIMMQFQRTTHPDRFLLVRFFLQGFVLVIATTLVISVLLGWLDRKDHIAHASDMARERAVQVVARIFNVMQALPPETSSTATVDGIKRLQELVAVETKMGNFTRLELVDEKGVVLAANNKALIGETAHLPEVAQAAELGQAVSRTLSPGNAYIRFASPFTVRGRSYVLLIDEPLTSLQAMLQENRSAMNWVILLGFGIGVSLLGITVYRARRKIERQEQREAYYKDMIGRHVSDRTAKQVLDQEGIQTEGEWRRVTVIFAAIRDLTSITAQVPPQRFVSLLNEYLAVMTEVVFKYDGMVDKVLGYELVIVFGAPSVHGNDARRALACAKEMQAVFNQLGQRWHAEGLSYLQQSIAINTGMAVVGCIGSTGRLDYTAIGEAVSMAHHLQGWSSSGEILASGSTLSLLDNEPAESLGKVKIRGRYKEVNVFRLVLN